MGHYSTSLYTPFSSLDNSAVRSLPRSHFPQEALPGLPWLDSVFPSPLYFSSAYSKSCKACGFKLPVSLTKLQDPSRQGSCQCCPRWWVSGQERQWKFLASNPKEHPQDFLPPASLRRRLNAHTSVLPWLEAWDLTGGSSLCIVLMNRL